MGVESDPPLPLPWLLGLVGLLVGPSVNWSVVLSETHSLIWTKFAFLLFEEGNNHHNVPSQKELYPISSSSFLGHFYIVLWLLIITFLKPSLEDLRQQY